MNAVGGQVVNKEEKKECESIKANVKTEVAVVLPLLPDNMEPDFQLELDYDTITQAVNDYIERYTIDSRINEIEYQLSTPRLPDENATNNLKGSLTGEIDKIIASTNTIQVDNKAIADEKVTLKFELSFKEDIYLNENDEKGKEKQKEHQLGSTFPQKGGVMSSAKKSQPTENKLAGGELIIQSSDPQLYWQNAPSAQLYWQNAPSNIIPLFNSNQNNRTPCNDEKVLENIKNFGAGLDEAMGSTDTLESGPKIFGKQIAKGKGYVKVGDNGRVYTNSHARGNQYYKIAGDFSKNKYVKNLGWAGKTISWGTEVYQDSVKYSQADSPQKKGKVLGEAVGKITSGGIAGGAASTITSGVLIAVAGAAGVASAPLTIVVIAGCSIALGVIASNFAEQYGEDIGGKVGEGVVKWWNNRKSPNKD